MAEKKQRVPNQEIRIEKCTEQDAEAIAAAMYSAFNEAWWAAKEPLETRPDLPIRIARLTNRTIRPSFTVPDMHWIKAIHIPTNTPMGFAGWAGPNHPLHCVYRRSAASFYNWPSTFNWTDAEQEEWWSHANMDIWDTKLAKADSIRGEVLGDEKHWYLAPLMVLPEWQGRGVASKLLDWAVVQADKTEQATPLYLEASVMGKPVYEHYGFVMVGDENMVRRGPKKVDGGKLEKKGLQVTEEALGQEAI